MKHVMIFFLGIFVLAGCGVFPAAGKTGETPEFFTAALWNVQALFDARETGKEYGDYLEAAGWTQKKYAARITAVSQAVLQMVQPDKAGAGSDTTPALIGFVELENLSILEDLARGELSKHGYLWTAFAAIPGAPLGVGFFSRFPFSDIRAHSITVGKETAPRPVLEARVEPGGKPLVFLLCHWKSKLGGDIATEAQRRSSARVVQRRLRELKESEADTPVIVMGDLNENHDEYYRHSGKVLCALLPDDPDAALLAYRSSTAAQDFLVISGEKPPRAVSFPKDVHVFYSPWEREMTEGSYYYKNTWETIDHFLLSDSLFDGRGWVFDSSQVLNRAPFSGSDGSPNTYNPRSGRGLSDHLPLLLCLRDLSYNSSLPLSASRKR